MISEEELLEAFPDKELEIRTLADLDRVIGILKQIQERLRKTLEHSGANQ